MLLRELHDASGPSENPKLIKVRELCNYALLHSKMRLGLRELQDHDSFDAEDGIEMRVACEIIRRVERRVALRALKRSSEFDVEMASRWSRQEAASAAKRQRPLEQKDSPA